MCERSALVYQTARFEILSIERCTHGFKFGSALLNLRRAMRNLSRIILNLSRLFKFAVRLMRFKFYRFCGVRELLRALKF